MLQRTYIGDILIVSSDNIVLWSSFITGSYDRTCKVWDTASGEELHVLEGHKNVVYAIAFNNPYGYVVSCNVS